MVRAPEDAKGEQRARVPREDGQEGRDERERERGQGEDESALGALFGGRPGEWGGGGVSDTRSGAGRQGRTRTRAREGRTSSNRLTRTLPSSHLPASTNARSYAASLFSSRAMSRPVLPPSSFASRSAPASISRRRETALPLTTAQWSGVRPEPSRVETDAPCRRSRSTEMASPGGWGADGVARGQSVHHARAVGARAQRRQVERAEGGGTHPGRRPT